MITVDYLGIQGSGKTIRDAKADAARKVAGFVEAAKSPLVYVESGHVMIAWQTGVNESAYTYVSPNTENGPRHYCSMQAGSAYDALRAARRHVAKNIGNASIADPSDRAKVEIEISESRAFTAAYRHAEASGITDPHTWACAHAREFAV
jgi:hypothetical protein